MRLRLFTFQFNLLTLTEPTRRRESCLSSSCCCIQPLHSLPRSKRETEGVVSLSTHHHITTTTTTPPSLEMRDGGVGFSVGTPPPSPPSLARNARRRGGFSVDTSSSPPRPLPHSKCETEGVVSLSSHHHHHHHPSLARNARRRGWFLCRHTTTITTPPSLKTRDRGGVSSVNTPPHPSLARNARRRVVSFVNPRPTAPSLKTRDGGVGSFANTLHPSLAPNARWKLYSHCRHIQHHHPL